MSEQSPDRQSPVEPPQEAPSHTRVEPPQQNGGEAGTAAPPAPTFDPAALDLEGKSPRGRQAGAAIEPRAKAEATPADAQGWWWGTGRRKAAVARVRMKPGNGEVKVQLTRRQSKTIDDYFTEPQDRADVYAPLEVTETRRKFDIVARVNGGGHMGQAQAIRLGIARALRKYDPDFEDALREHGHLTRDARKVERKKYGLAGARRSFQFSKR